MLKLKIFLGLIITTMLLVSCEIKNPTEGLEVRLQTISRTTGVNVDLIDGATGNPIEQTVSVSFIGDNKDKVITSSNEPITELTTQAGIAVFALEDGLIPTLNNPVYLNLSIASDGYNSVTKKIKVVKAGISNFTATLTSMQNPTSGVATGTDIDGQTGGNGAVQDTIAVTSGETASNNSDGEATVAVPPGTQLQDNSGNNLSGTVTTTIVYTDASNSEGASTLPGGDDAGASKDGSDQGGFAPACGIEIQMQVNGQQVGYIAGKEIEVAFILPRNSINPNTGQNYQAGETVGVYKYNAESGVWEWIKDLVLGEIEGEGAASKYLAKKAAGDDIGGSFSVGGAASGGAPPAASGSSTYVYYWPTYSVGNRYQTVNTRFKMVSTTGRSGTVYVSVDEIIAKQRIACEHGDEFDYSCITFAKNVNVSVYDSRTGGELLGQITVPDWSTAPNPIELTYTPKGISVQITVSVKCDSQADNPRVISPDGFPLWAMRVNSSGSEELSGWQSIGSFSNGTLTANLLENEYYKFKTEYDGEFYNSLDYETPFKVTSSGISYSIVDDNRVCDNF